MTAILKVDTIQDTGGNTIISSDGAGNITTSNLADNSVSLAKLTATGTKDATTFLRGDNTFATVAANAGTLSFQAYRSGNLSVSATTQTELVYNAEVHDGSSKYDTSTGRYTPGVAGTYFVNAGVSFAPDSNIGTGATGYLKIRKNGTGSEYGQISNQGSGDSNDEAWNTAAVIELGATDYISVWWYHTANSGNMLSVQSWFSGFRLD